LWIVVEFYSKEHVIALIQFIKSHNYQPLNILDVMIQ